MRQECDFFDRPKTKKWLKIGFFAILILLVLADFVIHKHSLYSWEELPGSFAVYAFGSGVVIIIAAKILGLLFSRRGDYYD